MNQSSDEEIPAEVVEEAHFGGGEGAKKKTAKEIYEEIIKKSKKAKYEKQKQKEEDEDKIMDLEGQFDELKTMLHFRR